MKHEDMDSGLVGTPYQTESRKSEPNRIYVDPFYNPDVFVRRFDVLPFLTDQALIYNPSRQNLQRWGYGFRRFAEFVKCNVFVPLSPGNEALSEYRKDHQLIRRQIMDESRFFAEYDRAVEEDANDEEFREIVESLYDSDVPSNPRDVSFSLNWDIIVASCLRAPALCDSECRRLWEYKIGTRTVSAARDEDAPTVQQVAMLERFLYEALGSLPLHLAVEDILDFRKDKCAVNFRKWFHEKARIVMDAEKVTHIDADAQLFREFKELGESYDKKSAGIGAVVTAAVAVGVSLVAGPISGAASLAGQLVFPRIVRKLQKKYSHRNWVLVLIDLRKRTLD
ncbi:MAG: hypothetical protein KAW09_03070 [Thermoplasmata archaeon]|nr:hypothetical protein [Thermoplasmata archaeon]